MGTFAYLKKALISQLFYSLPELMVYLQTYGDMRGVKKKKRKRRPRTKNLSINLKVTRKRKVLYTEMPLELKKAIH